MLSSIIVDDEQKSRESLQIMLSDFCEDVKVKALCQNVAEGLNAIKEHKPDIVFLDINMQRETGFDLLKKLDKVDFELIFTTAYAEYAIKAFKFSAIDYLLKPIDIDELRAAVDKAREKRSLSLASRLEQLVHNLRPSAPQKYKLALPTSDGLVFIRVEDILFCEADSNYTQVHLLTGTKYIVTRTLKDYDELLSEHDFFRIHNSFLINLNHIKSYVRGEGGYVIMSNDKHLDVAKRKKEGFLKRISS